jgi:hypothetical protein
MEIAAATETRARDKRRDKTSKRDEETRLSFPPGL